MEPYTVFPDKPIVDAGPVSRTFLDLEIGSFHVACAWVHDLPYGYNLGACTSLWTLVKGAYGDSRRKDDG